MSRRRSAVLVLAAIALGLASRRIALGFALWDKSLGDVLYAVMIFGLVALVRPRARPLVIGAVAFATCFAIEVFQLTGIPKTLPRLLRAAIGDSFAWHDVGCYAVGVLVVLVTSRIVAAMKDR